MPSYALHRLRDLRLAGERQAEQALAAASATLRGATDEQQRLEALLAMAQAAEATARLDPAVPATAGDGQTQRRYWSRLVGQTQAHRDALALHGARVLEPAERAVAAARAAHLRARQRREVIERALARREAEGRLHRARRAEAEADDRSPRRRS